MIQVELHYIQNHMLYVQYHIVLNYLYELHGMI